ECGESDGIGDAQGCKGRGDQGACRSNARSLDRICPQRQAGSPRLAAVAALSARGSHDHALRQHDRTGQRPRRAWLAQALAKLAVKPQEVIPGQTESADRWLACEANMRPVPVVAMEPSGQRGISLL